MTVTAVETSSDMKYAKVFVSRIGDADEKKETLGALVSASGFLRKELARRLRLRHTPVLSFRWDGSIERGARLLRLMDRASDESAGRQLPSPQD